MGLTITQTKPLKTYQHVVEQIQAAIFSGELEPGERLPPEMKLKEMFDTSRGTVREALRVLEQKGLIRVSTGAKGGARIQPANTHAMEESMGVLIRQNKVCLEHLAGFRTLLEGHAAQEAAQKAEPDDLVLLGKILDQIRAHAKTDPDNWDEFNRLDAKFHLALAAMGKNPLVEANLKTVHGNVYTYFTRFLPFSRDLLDKDIQDLSLILNAVSRKDAKDAARLARAHVERFAVLMKEPNLGKDQ
ncbi:MAG: FadR family transcriptional regulator [Desulfobacter sp.]|nr:FadR family transcriptional regulator [Desulfobacter sp.]WDP87597.1 MAG: FadR family transcriptional regulator [Desulfobacter sp.]